MDASAPSVTVSCQPVVYTTLWTTKAGIIGHHTVLPEPPFLSSISFEHATEKCSQVTNKSASLFTEATGLRFLLILSCVMTKVRTYPTELYTW